MGIKGDRSICLNGSLPGATRGCSGREVSVVRGGETMKRGFTLIGFLVVIAVIGVIVVVLLLGLNPGKRVSDAQARGITSQTSALGSVYELCLGYVNVASTPAVQNTPADCGLRDAVNDVITTVLSAATPPPAGGPFLRFAPTGTFRLTPGTAANPNGCILGIRGAYWAVFESSNNRVTSGSSGSPVCP